MSKQKRLVIIGEQEYPLDGVVLKLTLAQLQELFNQEQKIATTHCISQLRPFVSGETGRARLESIELAFNEEVVLVEEEVREAPEYVFIDDERGQIIEGVDFERVIQTITRRTRY